MSYIVSYNLDMMISIITINFNSSEYTIKLVNSIFNKVSSDIRYQIIITDNASESSDYQNLIDNIPKDKNIKIIRSNVNTGFAGGNMSGYKESSGEYLLFINNDCECINDVVTPLVDFMKKNKSVGLITGKIKGKDGKYAGSHCLFPCISKSLFGTEMCRLLHTNKFISPKKPVTKPMKVQVVTGAFMFFNRSVFEDINGFDTNFFLDCEEEDISKRVWDIGKDVYMIPEPEVIHEHGGSKDSNPDISNEYYISYRKLIFKHYSTPYALIMMLFVYLKLIRNIIYMRTNLNLIKIALQGFPESKSLRYKQKKQ